MNYDFWADDCHFDWRRYFGYSKLNLTIQKRPLTFHVNKQQSTTNSIYNEYYSQEKVCEPLFTPRTDFIIQPKGTLLPNTQPRFRCANSKVSDPIELAEHEFGGLPGVHVRILGSPRRRHRNIGRVGAGGCLRRGDDEGGPLDVRWTFEPPAGGLGSRGRGHIEGRHLKRIHNTRTSKTITDSGHITLPSYTVCFLLYSVSVYGLRCVHLNDRAPWWNRASRRRASRSLNCSISFSANGRLRDFRNVRGTSVILFSDFLILHWWGQLICIVFSKADFYFQLLYK